MTEPGASPLLTCLTKLNDDARAEVLLPKLIKQGSAKAVAATCTQLRDLCFRTVQTVKLADLHLIPDTYSAEDWVAPLPEHFCNCTSLVAVLADEQDTPKLPRMLPGIARWVRACFVCRVYSVARVADRAPAHSLCGRKPGRPAHLHSTDQY